MVSNGSPKDDSITSVLTDPPHATLVHIFASKIVVVDNNAIVDVGTHQELLGRCTKYEELVRRQLQSSSDGAAQLQDAARSGTEI